MDALVGAADDAGRADAAAHGFGKACELLLVSVPDRWDTPNLCAKAAFASSMFNALSMMALVKC